MKISCCFVCALLLVGSGLVAGHAKAGRFGGGGGARVGGGGGFHGGGGYRGGAGGFQGGGARMGGGGFAGGAPVHRPSAMRPASGMASRPASNYSVHGPYGGFGGASLPRSATTLPRSGFSRPGGGGAGERHVWDTPRGGTIVAGGDRGPFGGQGGYIYSGPHGAVSIGGGKGGSISGPGGREIAGGKAGHVLIGPNGNVHAGGSQGAAVKGPNGAAIAGSHGGVTVGPGGAIAHGSRGGAATGPGGTIAGGSRGGVAVGPHGAVAGGGRFVAGRGQYGAGFAGTRFVAASDLRGQGAVVRNNFRHYNSFTPGWYNRHPGAWYAAGWVTGSIWNTCTWSDCASYYGYGEDTSPIYYNYGDNVTYQDDGVYYGDQMYATQQEYAQQAQQIATAGAEAQPAADDEKWQALGVFAMIQGDETTSNDIFQIALNDEGVLRGNYYNAVSDSTIPLAGSLDKTTQRVAWTLQGKTTPVYEAGLYNLTQGETTLLAHFDKDRTEQYKLVRVEQPEQPMPDPGN